MPSASPRRNICRLSFIGITAGGLASQMMPKPTSGGSDMTLTTQRSSRIFRRQKVAATRATRRDMRNRRGFWFPSGARVTGATHPGPPTIRPQRRETAGRSRFVEPEPVRPGQRIDPADSAWRDPSTTPHAGPLWLQPGGRVRFRLAAWVRSSPLAGIPGRDKQRSIAVDEVI
jgi:hypothetical protein